MLSQLFVVRLDAQAATVDGRYGQTKKLEIKFLNPGIPDDIHAQPRRQPGIFGVAHQMEKTIVDVIHSHDGRRGARRGHMRVIQMRQGQCLNAARERNIA